MAHPKSKISKQRKRKRRTHKKLAMPNVTKCSNCESPVMRHRVCGACGFYRGKDAMSMTIEVVEEA